MFSDPVQLGGAETFISNHYIKKQILKKMCVLGGSYEKCFIKLKSETILLFLYSPKINEAHKVVTLHSLKPAPKMVADVYS